MAKKLYKKKAIVKPLKTDKEIVEYENEHKLYFMKKSITNITKHLHKENRKGFK